MDIFFQCYIITQLKYNFFYIRYIRLYTLYYEEEMRNRTIFNSMPHQRLVPQSSRNLIYSNE